jgi:hypothetical protein
MSKKSSQRWDIRHPDSRAISRRQAVVQSFREPPAQTFLEASGALSDYDTTRRRRLSSITRAPCRNVMGVLRPKVMPQRKAPLMAGLELGGRGLAYPASLGRD